MACAFAWRELSSARRGHAKAMLAALQEHGRQLTEERTRNRPSSTPSASASPDARTVIEKLRVMVGEPRLQVSGLRGDTGYLAGEVIHRENVISACGRRFGPAMAELITCATRKTARCTTCRGGYWPSTSPSGNDIPGVDRAVG